MSFQYSFNKAVHGESESSNARHEVSYVTLQDGDHTFTNSVNQLLWIGDSDTATMRFGWSRFMANKLKVTLEHSEYLLPMAEIF